MLIEFDKFIINSSFFKYKVSMKTGQSKTVGWLTSPITPILTMPLEFHSHSLEKKA